MNSTNRSHRLDPTRVLHSLLRSTELPHYAYGAFAAADLAGRLSLPAITVAEFGVAGGSGLLELERLAREVQQLTGVDISVVGLDTGTGMPAPLDYRDLPYLWREGFYRMDRQLLTEELTSAQLFLGDVSDTVLSIPLQAPIGFIAFDLDYYSSTKSSFKIFDRPPETRLPRVYCYFDDIVWPEVACHNEYTGELCAIREFNAELPDKKLCPIHLLGHMRDHAPWCDQLYILHDFHHPRYCHRIIHEGSAYGELPLKRAARNLPRASRSGCQRS